MPWDQQTDHSLANMYQRLPGHALAAINPLKPCNFAALEIPAWAPKEAIAYNAATSNRGDCFSTWKTYTLPNEAKLKHDHHGDRVHVLRQHPGEQGTVHPHSKQGDCDDRSGNQ